MTLGGNLDVIIRFAIGISANDGVFMHGPLSWGTQLAAQPPMGPACLYLSEYKI